MNLINKNLNCRCSARMTVKKTFFLMSKENKLWERGLSEFRLVSKMPMLMSQNRLRDSCDEAKSKTRSNLKQTTFTKINLPTLRFISGNKNAQDSFHFPSEAQKIRGITERHRKRARGSERTRSDVLNHKHWSQRMKRHITNPSSKRTVTREKRTWESYRLSAPHLSQRPYWTSGIRNDRGFSFSSKMMYPATYQWGEKPHELLTIRKRTDETRDRTAVSVPERILWTPKMRQASRNNTSSGETEVSGATSQAPKRCGEFRGKEFHVLVCSELNIACVPDKWKYTEHGFIDWFPPIAPCVRAEQENRRVSLCTYHIIDQKPDRRKQACQLCWQKELEQKTGSKWYCS